jgi:hypothetical protein
MLEKLAEPDRKSGNNNRYRLHEFVILFFSLALLTGIRQKKQQCAAQRRSADIIIGNNLIQKMLKVIVIVVIDLLLD